jgi:UDP-N-acetylglucosamine enolpyruvyl transferase
MHIDRGYPHFVEDLQKLGGKIERVGESEESF